MTAQGYRRICMLTGIMAAALTVAGSAAPLTDPTRPSTPGWQAPTTARPAGSYELNSILVSPERRVAVINDSQVVEGERIGNATVISIRRNNVVLQADERRITLELLPDIGTGQP